MSRLTASPFHKPSAFSFPRPPLSPPETTTDIAGPTVSVAGGINHYAQESESQQAPAHPIETPGARFRRVSSLAYNTHQASNRDRALHRNKTFIIVIPPQTLLQEHGQLGHTLATGPSHRLSQGLLMPLFPTMYAQLTAIAKEFNFPSTTGLCLYLQYTEHGVTVCPRISDDSWQLIWSHVFESAASPSGLAPPISGKVEFDIDLRLARWYSSWIASHHHGHYGMDYPLSMPPSHSATPPSGHYRDRSGTTEEEQLEEEMQQSTIIQPSRQRHVPRALSLVDRLETMSMRSVPRQQALSPPANVISAAKTLSPVYQADEPQTANLDLEKRVESWLETAVPVDPLAGTGQISLDPTNMPNIITLDNTEEVDEELNLEDYQWSISSRGPASPGTLSPVSWRGVRSVYLENRAEGSVCLSPVTCTSFGPSDYTADPEWYTTSERALSPDLAHRMYEECPPTPMTATSWGAQSVDLDSAASEHHSLYLDLGHRAVFSPALTEATATSWGAPSFPPSPVISERPLTPDIGYRTWDSTRSMQVRQPWGLGWPYFNAVTKPEEFRPIAHVEASQAVTPWNYVWPYHKATGSQKVIAWQYVWPFHESDLTQLVTSQATDSSRPVAKPWQYTWPFYQVESEVAGPWQYIWPYYQVKVKVHAKTSRSHPPCSPWKFVWPYVQVLQPCRQSEQATTSGYPYFCLYPSVYPHFDLYPSIIYSKGKATSRHTMGRSLPYPYFCLYPAVYPHFDLYPSLGCVASSRSLASRTPGNIYPNFNLYPAVYPYNLDEIYPITQSQRSPAYSSATSQYPMFNLYPSIQPRSRKHVERREVNTKVSQYPDFNLYPSVSKSTLRSESLGTSQYPDFVLYPPMKAFLASPSTTKTSKSSQATGYPHFNLYPPVLLRRAATSFQIDTTIRVIYPMFNLYPASYPKLDIYPAIGNISDEDRQRTGYPDFCLYPPVRQGKRTDTLLSSSHKVVRINQMSYPIFDLYPAVYPAFNLYPHLPSASAKEWKPKTRQYPDFMLYSPGYPYFDLYPVDVYVAKKNVGTSRVKVAQIQYPYFVLYPAVYPHFNLYPSLSSFTAKRVEEPIQYPFFVLYPAVYPHFDLYTPVRPLMKAAKRARRTHTALRAEVLSRRPVSRKTHAELHALVFTTGFYNTPSGSPIPQMQSQSPVQQRPSVTRSRSGSVMKSPLPPLPGSTSPSRISFYGPRLPEQSTVLSRTSSLMSASRSTPRAGATLERSNSNSSAPRKRDSLVLQRIKAFNSVPEDSTHDVVSKFPMPPVTRGPAVSLTRPRA